MTKRVTLIVGLPGAGKSTLSNILEDNSIYTISSSKLLHNLDKDTKNNIEYNYINNGIDIPDDIYVDMVINCIDSSNKEMFLIEGFPYNSNQRVLAESKFKEKDIKISKVIYLNIPEEKAINRILDRRVCPNCNKVYGDKKPICDICGSETIIRKDDSESIARDRIRNLDLYLDEIVNYYKQKGILIEFDLTTNNIKELINSSFRKKL